MLRLVFESESNNNTNVFDTTLCQLDHIVRLLIALAQHSNSQYELKYSLNDVFMKLMRQIKSQPDKRRSLVRHLNLGFLDRLAHNDLFSASELSSLLIKLVETPAAATVGSSSPSSSSSSSSSSSLSSVSSSANSSPTIPNHHNHLLVDSSIRQQERVELIYRPWLRLFALDVFRSNHLFRERVVEHMLNLVNQVKN